MPLPASAIHRSVSRGRLLSFVEDPGAANCVAPVLEPLRRRGWEVTALAAGIAYDYLRERCSPIERLPLGARADNLLRRSDPAAIIVGTSENKRTIAHDLVAQARHRGVMSVGLVDSAANSSLRFRGRTDNPLFHAPDWLLVADEWSRRTYTEIGFPQSRIVITGHPHYDSVVERKAALDAEGRRAVRARVMPGVPPERPIVVFLSETSTGLDAEQFRRSALYTFAGRGDCDGRTEIVLEEVLDALATLPRRPYVVLRLHPKNRVEEFARYQEEVDAVSVDEPPLDLVYAADLVIGMSTSLLLEAAILGRATLSVLPRALERDWLPSVRSGITPCATDRAELRRLVAATWHQTPPGSLVGECLHFGAVGRVVGFFDAHLSTHVVAP